MRRRAGWMKGWARVALALVLATGLTTCKKGATEIVGPAGPERPDPMVSFEPGDLVTSAVPSALRVVVDNYGDPVGTDKIKEISSRLSLKTWPELGDVFFEIEALDADATNKRAVINIKPTGELSERWYTIHLSALPAGFRLHTLSRINAKPLGQGLIARFRMGSQPILIRVEACGPPSSIERLSLVTSEAFAFGDPAALITVTQGVANPCRSTANAESGALTFECTSLDRNAPVALDFASGLRGASGVALRDPSGRDAFRVAFTPSAELQTDRCAIYLPPAGANLP